MGCLYKLTRKTDNALAVTLLVFVFLVYFRRNYFYTIYQSEDDSHSNIAEVAKPKEVENKTNNKPRETFIHDWCQQKKLAVDWKTILEPCKDYLSWGSNKKLKAEGLRTDATKSFISHWRIREAGQFSRVVLQTVTTTNIPKRFGGDSWRVRITGPSSLSPFVTDHNNGTYDVTFLPLEAGEYRLYIVLEHSLCDGFMDPPKEWFIKGNAQGKYQPPDILPGKDKPFLIQPLHGTAPLLVNILPGPNITLKGVNKWMNYTKSDVCSERCNHLWARLGRWKNERWSPYSEANQRYSNHFIRRRRKGILWVYGDSIGDFFYKSILKRPLCTTIFNHCNRTYNWVYAIPGANLAKARFERDDLDFSIDRVLSEITSVVSSNNMDEYSVVVLNLGLHYVQNVNFSSYQELVGRVIDLFKGHGQRLREKGRKFPGVMIWKTTTAINMEKYGDPKTNARHSKLIRFLTYQRVLLYNAYATQAMCAAGVPVLDVFPLSDSYKNGTGLPHKPYDAVHYPSLVFESVIKLLENIFGKQLTTAGS